MRRLFYLLFMGISLIAVPVTAHGEDSPAVLVIVLDGLRPDYVTPELMPNLHALGEAGIMGARHHSAIPTVTRVNASTLATGSHPGTHGILGNTIYIPEVDPERGISTSDVKNLIKVEEATGGHLLTTPSLGEILDTAGKEILVVSSGSSGSSFLLNHKGKGRGIINVENIVPESRRAEVIRRLGDVPIESEPNNAQNAWIVDAFFMELEENGVPDLTFMWLSDPDHTTHEFGIGSEENIQSLHHVDREIARLVAKRTAAGLDSRLNIIVTADHGFSTHTGEVNLNALLREHDLDDSLVNVSGALYVRSGDEDQMRSIIELVKPERRVGAIFSKLGLGTLTPYLIHWQHSRTPDIWVTPNWTDGKNEHGYAGTSYQGGTAGHGTLSPFDIHATLIVNGPAFKSQKKSSPFPTGNVDIAPTVCHLLGIVPTIPMDGRILHELLNETGTKTPSVVTPSVMGDVSIAPFAATLELSEYAGTDYIDSATVTRNP